MVTNAVTVEGSGRNISEDDCILNCLPEMKACILSILSLFKTSCLWSFSILGRISGP
ncbi:unnamed protein product [Penicillium nalgiovense]|uniref:Uncharacterized protein n=1 Tax=Penicillium nalgiovense TaxID=60175 RepID=A0A9W4HN86_PENNA|nr:unnamed protein product [Penicillium nalgiovense]CAG8061858.1 unnamed protein product [Penicillium nalgiovense]CAG8065075.1 unnamed protein product [Penicillium nalgiovense]CAG8066078.1 unnamed protein product [Penicillium nalgiovense]CAG8067940.1 unnamed protein product [Penicillium nalgiovense]